MNYDNEATFKELARALEDVADSEREGEEGYLAVVAAEAVDGQFVCSPSTFTVAFEQFELTLQDVISRRLLDQFL